MNKLWFVSANDVLSAVVSAYTAELAVATLKKECSWDDSRGGITVVPLDDLQNGMVVAVESHEWYDSARKRLEKVRRYSEK